MNTSTQTWQPVALIAASLSNDNTTTVEVVHAGHAIYVAALNRGGDSTDTRMTPQEARQLAQALLVAAAQQERAQAARAAVVRGQSPLADVVPLFGRAARPLHQ